MKEEVKRVVKKVNEERCGHSEMRMPFICNGSVNSRDKKREEKMSISGSPEDETLGELTSHFDPLSCRKGHPTITMRHLVVGTAFFVAFSATQLNFRSF